MSRYTPAARIWVVAVTLAALTLSGVRAFDGVVGLPALAALVLLGTAAGVAHAFPVRSSSGGSSYHLTNVFIVAGIIILPPALLVLLPLLAISPLTWWSRRRRPGAVIGWAFNVAQTVLAAHVAALVAGLVHGRPFHGVFDLAVLGAAAVLFNVVQATLVGVAIALNSRVPFRRTNTFSPTALQGEFLLDLIGLAVAGLWLAQPVLLVLVAPLLAIAHRMTRAAHLAELAQVDGKTGLHNSRHFERALEDELAHGTRVGRPLAVLFFDLDHFKQVNDRHGHAAGDHVLRDLSGVLIDTLRKGDVIARFGGEEFVALLPGTDGAEATFLAERLRATVEAHTFATPEGGELHCTVSVGVALYPADATDVSGLLNQADAAMYRAKETRNAIARPPGSAAVPSLAGATDLAPVVNVQPAGADAALPAPAPLQRSPMAPVAMWGVISTGLGFALVSIAAVALHNDWIALAPFLAAALIAELMEVRIYEIDKERMSFSFTIAVTMGAVAAIPAGAPLVSALAALVHVVSARQRKIDKALFNVANPALSALTASFVYLLLRPEAGTFAAWHLAAALVAVVVFHAVNFGVVSLMISLHSRRPFGQVVRSSSWYAPTKIFLGLTGAFLAGSYDTLGLIGVTMFVVPVLLMRFTLVFYARSTRKTIESLQAAKAEVEIAHQEQEETLRGLIETMSSVIDAREPWVLGHSRRVATYAVAIGREMGLSVADLAIIHTGGLLHDLGKIGIPEAILNKPGKLNDDEYAVMKQHAIIGERILAEVAPLRQVTRIVGEHHERWDGSGYPRGRSGTDISRGGRIVALADALDAILSRRPYSEGRDLEWALEEARRCAGTHFDPEAVTALVRAVEVNGVQFFSSSTRHLEEETCCRRWSLVPHAQHARFATVIGVPLEAEVAGGEPRRVA